MRQSRRSATAESFTPNAAGQITSVTAPGGGTTSYTYDAAGNRLTLASGNGTTTYT